MNQMIVPPLPMRGRQIDAPVGMEEGDLCARMVDGQWCQGRIKYLPDDSDGGGCSCHISPPCGYCTSTEAECVKCGWRDAE